MQLVDISNYISEISDPPKALLEMNRLVASLQGKGETFNQATWSLDPTIPKEISEATMPGSERKLWTNVIFDKFITPITAWPEGMKMAYLKNIVLNQANRRDRTEARI